MSKYKKYSSLILLSFGLLFLTSCASKKGLVQDGKYQQVKLKKRTTNYLLKRLKVNGLDAEWLSARAKINFKDAAQTRKFTANIRIRKDSIIWLNVKKLSVEAFRILVTRDSVYIINRFGQRILCKRTRLF